ncbi:MAG: hypothetical protein NTZ35_13070 [Ignavibacteriales bacterium]|nr:hypothetical protein [Ignavibacteriales bacterium]
MRSMILFFILPAIALVALGCDESFSPKQEFEEQYVLQCFISVYGSGVNPATVTAVLARTYDVNGVDPTINTNDPGIAGAEISVVVNQKLYYLQGAQRVSPDTSRYRNRQWIYTKTVPAVVGDAAVSLTARLPNGKTLSARTTIPGGRNFTSNYDFVGGLYPRVNPQPGKPNWTISWDNYSDVDVHLFVPRLTIAYTKLVQGVEIPGRVTVPSQYVSSPGGTIAIYPSLSTQKQCSFDFAALDSAMAQISAGDSDKIKFGVHSAKLEVIEYDLALSKYFSSINGSLDQFSIRTDESVYSNVGGGIGILGSSMTHWWEFPFDERYVRLYGYRYR